MYQFQATLKIIDGNPYLFVPDEILEALFVDAGKASSPIPIHGLINGRPYRQTLVRFRGAWRLYVNMVMLDDSPRRIGEEVTITLAYDPIDRTLEPHPKLVSALAENPAARQIFDGLAPSLQQEIIRYIDKLKSEASVDKNVQRAIAFLLGEERFIGRNPITPK